MSDDFFDPFSDDNTAVDTTGVDADNVNNSGAGINCTGRFHFQIESVTIETEPKGDKPVIPEVVCQMRVLAGEAESEVGKMMRHKIRLAVPVDWKDWSQGMKPLEDADKKGIVCLLYAFGVIGEEAFGQAGFKYGREMFERLEQTQAIGEISSRESKDKNGNDRTYFQCYNNNFWKLDSDEVKDVPKDVEAMAYAQTGAVSDADLDI